MDTNLIISDKKPFAFSLNPSSYSDTLVFILGLLRQGISFSTQTPSDLPTASPQQICSLHFYVTNILPLISSLSIFTWVAWITGAQYRVICLSRRAGPRTASHWGWCNHLLDQHWEQRRPHLLSQTKVNKLGFLVSIANILESCKEGHKNSQTPLSQF